jgi:photosystem II stability/assembly factor-like uncharacterized protein
MSFAKAAPVIIALALVTVTASACSVTAGTPVSSYTPTPAPNATAATAIAELPVPGILVSPSTPIQMPSEASLSAPSGGVVWALIQGGLLYRSTDRGATWQPRPIPPGNFPRPEISFIDEQQGWFATGGVPETQCNGARTTIWHTADGGNTWQQVAAVAPGSLAYRQCKEGVSFVDALHGYLGASDPNSRPTIYRTADGGHTWAPSTLPDPPGFLTLGAGDALSPGLVKAFGKTILIPAWRMQPSAQMETEFIFRSVDDGATWTYLATTGLGSNNVTLVTESRWLKISNDRSAQETTDTGKSWHPYPSDYQDAAGVSSVFVFGDPLVGYGTVRGGIRRTIDGGMHWALLKTPGAA